MTTIEIAAPTRATWKGHGRPTAGVYYSGSDAKKHAEEGTPVTIEVGSKLLTFLGEDGEKVNVQGLAGKFWFAPTVEAAEEPTPVEVEEPQAAAQEEAPAEVEPETAPVEVAPDPVEEPTPVEPEPVAPVAEAETPKPVEVAKPAAPAKPGQLAREPKAVLAGVLFSSAGDIVAGWAAITARHPELADVDVDVAAEQLKNWLKYLPTKHWDVRLPQPK